MKTKNTPHSKNLQETAEAVLRETFKAISTYIRKEENFQIHNLNCHLKKLEKGEQTKSRQKEIID